MSGTRPPASHYTDGYMYLEADCLSDEEICEEPRGTCTAPSIPATPERASATASPREFDSCAAAENIQRPVGVASSEEVRILIDDSSAPPDPKNPANGGEASPVSGAGHSSGTGSSNASGASSIENKFAGVKFHLDSAANIIDEILVIDFKQTPTNPDVPTESPKPTTATDTPENTTATLKVTDGTEKVTDDTIAEILQSKKQIEKSLEQLEAQHPEHRNEVHGFWEQIKSLWNSLDKIFNKYKGASITGIVAIALGLAAGIAALFGAPVLALAAGGAAIVTGGAAAAVYCCS